MISPLGTVRSSCNHRSTVRAQGAASDGRPTPRARINPAVSLLLTTGSSSIRRTLRIDTPVFAAIAVWAIPLPGEAFGGRFARVERDLRARWDRPEFPDRERAELMEHAHVAPA